MTVAENGADMARFPSISLASCAGMCPGNHELAGKQASGKSRPDVPWLNALGPAATAAIRGKNTYLASRYKRIAIRHGNKRALVAVGHTMLTSIRYMLTNGADHNGLGADYFLQRTGCPRQTRRLVSQLNILGYQVPLRSVDAG